MGIYRPIVRAMQKGNHTGDANYKPSDKIVTPATVLTVARMFIGAYGGYRLATGKRYGATLVGTALATDMEGKIARLVDNRFPNAGRGTSKFGIKIDPIADVEAALLGTLGTIVSPKTSGLGRLAAGIVASREVGRARWYQKTNQAYMDAQIANGNTRPEPIVIAASNEGKEAFVEACMAVGLAALTTETDNPILRTGYGALAVAHAVISARRGQSVIAQDYAPRAERMIAAISLC